MHPRFIGAGQIALHPSDLQQVGLAFLEEGVFDKGTGRIILAHDLEFHRGQRILLHFHVGHGLAVLGFGGQAVQRTLAHEAFEGADGLQILTLFGEEDAPLVGAGGMRIFGGTTSAQHAGSQQQGQQRCAQQAPVGRNGDRQSTAIAHVILQGPVGQPARDKFAGQSPVLAK